MNKNNKIEIIELPINCEYIKYIDNKLILKYSSKCKSTIEENVDLRPIDIFGNEVE